jgi:hypothetical protein
LERNLKELIKTLVGNLDELDRSLLRQRLNCILLFQENTFISLPVRCEYSSELLVFIYRKQVLIFQTKNYLVQLTGYVWVRGGAVG